MRPAYFTPILIKSKHVYVLCFSLQFQKPLQIVSLVTRKRPCFQNFLCSFKQFEMLSDCRIQRPRFQKMICNFLSFQMLSEYTINFSVFVFKSFHLIITVRACAPCPCFQIQLPSSSRVRCIINVLFFSLRFHVQFKIVSENSECMRCWTLFSKKSLQLQIVASSVRMYHFTILGLEMSRPF